MVRYALHWPEALTAIYAGVLTAFWLLSWRRWRLITVPLTMTIVISGVFFSLTTERQFAGVEWQAPWGKVPTVEHDGDLVKVHNVRAFQYRSEQDYDIRYVDLTLDPAGVQTIDLAVSHWDGILVIAHTMLSFGFADGQRLVVSMETRLPKGEEQGFLPGLYRQYELCMVLGVEEDLFQLRTDYRKEDLYLYRTNATPEQAREALDFVLHRANSLAQKPEFYNSIQRNCTTSLAPLLRSIDPSFTGDIRMLLNGYSDELLFELGYLAHHEGETFAELKARRSANHNLAAPSDSAYSERIRTFL